MKNFNGCIVKVKGYDNCNISGKKVIETVRWLSCGNSESTLYEVKLNDGKNYQLYEDEMVKD